MSRSQRELLEWVKVIVIGVLLVVVVRSFLVTNYTVAGNSMNPTLFNEDKLIVSKLSYVNDSIARGDVIIFHVSDEKDYVKRVIGTPGDRIEYIDDELFVNKKKINEPYLSAYFQYNHPDIDWTKNFQIKEVPKGKYFVLGDNRKKSTDSRHFGFVSESQVVGKVVYRYWPLNKRTNDF